MNDKDFLKLTKEDKAILGEMFTEMLEVIVKDLPTETVITQRLLVFMFCKKYKKANESQVNECLFCYKSKFNKSNCPLVYMNKPVINAYAKELTKRCIHKLVTQNRKVVSRLKDMLVCEESYIIL